MSTTNDSVQTLLKQRRELRQCLQELREEISDLNKRAQSMPAAARNAGEKQVGENIAPVLITSAPKKSEIPEKAVEKTIVAEAEKPDEVSSSKSSGTETEEICKDNTVAADEPVTDPKKNEVELQDEDVDGLDETTLSLRASLLSDYLANHPTTIDGKKLEALDACLQLRKDMSGGQDEEGQASEFRKAYREVSTASYEENQINGETLADSMGNVTLLWGLPVLIASLVLVAFPFTLLVQSVASRMFIPGFSNDILLVLEGVIAFLWGGAGALSILSWQVASDVRKRTYFHGMIRDLGLRFAFGGTLALACLLLIGSWLPFSGILEDMVVGIIAFFIGIPSTILFKLLFRFLVYR